MLLIIGANGQIGRALNAIAGNDVVALDREQIDLSHPHEIKKQLEKFTPEAVINAAAYTQVDKAEAEEALATVINGEAPAVMAEFCKSRGIPFIHYSTDYVYDGSGDTPWREDSPTAPLSAYGRSKLAGDEAVQAVGGDFLIFRTSWVYDAYGKNFVNTMLRLGREREVLKVVSDQYGAPSYAPHLAAATLAVLKKLPIATLSLTLPLKGEESAPRRVGEGDKPQFPSGIYHMCGSGETSWHGFAEEIFAQARARGVELAVKEVVAISSAEYPVPAPRPHNSRLDCSKLHATFGITIPDWRTALREYTF